MYLDSHGLALAMLYLQNLFTVIVPSMTMVCLKLFGRRKAEFRQYGVTFYPKQNPANGPALRTHLINEHKPQYGGVDQFAGVE
jgi:hypothetical protein